MSLPDKPFTALTPEQLTRFAQIIDTALFKSYLLIRPGLLASLCRSENWCEVSEVEEVLLQREVCQPATSMSLRLNWLSQKFSELIDLYNGKKMHGQALALLRRLVFSL